MTNNLSTLRRPSFFFPNMLPVVGICFQRNSANKRSMRSFLLNNLGGACTVLVTFLSFGFILTRPIPQHSAGFRFGRMVHTHPLRSVLRSVKNLNWKSRHSNCQYRQSSRHLKRRFRACHACQASKFKIINTPRKAKHRAKKTFTKAKQMAKHSAVSTISHSGGRFHISNRHSTCTATIVKVLII